MISRIIKINLKSISGQFIILIFTVVLAAASMIAAIYMLKAMKLEDADRCLQTWGNYDMAFCDVKGSLENEVKKDSRTDFVGEVYDYGEASLDGKNVLTGAVRDSKTQHMLYLNPAKGRYPEKKNEICVDERFLKSLGTKKTVGDYVTLVSDGADGKSFSAKYRITGIINAVRPDGGEIISKRRYPESTVKRYIENTVENTDNVRYENFPLAYVYPDKKRCIRKKHLLINIKDKDYISGFAEKYLHDESLSDKFKFDLERWNGRLFTTANILSYHQLETGTALYSSTNKIISGGEMESDPFSKYLIPLYSVLIVLISIAGVCYISFDRQQKRYKNYKILFNLGLRKQIIVFYLIFETLFLIVFSSAAGVLFSQVFTKAAVKVSDTFLGTNIAQISFIRGYYEKYIDMVTPDLYKIPLVTLALVLAANLFLNLIIFYVRCVKKKKRCAGRKIRSKSKTKEKRITLLFLMTKKVNRGRGIVNAGISITTAVVLMSVVFGFSFFSVYTMRLTREQNEELKMSEISGFDHRIVNSDRVTNGFSQYMHESGISREKYEDIASQKYIKNSDYVMSEHSTAMILNKKSGKVHRLKQQSEYIRSEVSDKNVILDNMAFYGYFRFLGIDTKKDEVINVPTIGLSGKKIGDLKVIAGKIDISRIKSGEEVIAAVRDKSMKNVFTPGEKIDLYDFVRPADADNYYENLEGVCRKSTRRKSMNTPRRTREKQKPITVLTAL